MRDVPLPQSLQANQAGSWEAALMERGALSIVVQGPLRRANAAEVQANVCHWRALFPNAELILSVSTSEFDEIGQGPLEDTGRPAPLRSGPSSPEIDSLRRLCDRIVLADEATILPPLKFGETAPNHGNVQIAAARAGLRLAGGTYILRVRNDLIFQDRRFLRHYYRRARQSRRLPFGFHDRVMISQLFTLNPYGLERLPFHFGDFFHFGRNEDIRAIWLKLPDMMLTDSLYYKDNRHASHSNKVERRFQTRFGVEQHIHFNAAKRSRDGLCLDFHNDHRSIHESIECLLNDFVICDMAACNAVFSKWGHLFADPLMQVLCVTDEDWLVMNRIDAQHERSVYLRAKADSWLKRMSSN